MRRAWIVIAAWAGFTGLVYGAGDRMDTAEAVSAIARAAVPLSATVDELKAQDFAFLDPVVGDARVVGFGESRHGRHEMLILRNRIFEYLVERHGFSALAAETGFVDSVATDDFVIGAKTVAQQRAVEGVLSFGTSEPMDENRELIEWMRAYNERPATRRKLRFHGLDMMGASAREQPGNPYARKAFDAALAYLDTVDAPLAEDFRKRLEPSLASLAAKSYDRLTKSEREGLTVATADLISLFERRHVEWAERSGALAYHRAYRSSLDARGIDADFRAGGWWATSAARDIDQRDAELASHLRWLLEREGRDGRIFVFAHALHLRKGPDSSAEGKKSFTSMGEHLEEVLGHDLVVIGAADEALEGHAAEPAPLRKPNPADLNGFLRRVGPDLFAMNLRSPLSGALSSLLATAQLRYSPGDKSFFVHPLQSFDALIFVGTLTPAHQYRNASIQQ